MLERRTDIAYACHMSKVEQIEAEIANLSTGEAREIAQWLAEFLADEWDRQIEEDAKSGKLDFLFEEVEAERKAGTLRGLPGDKE